LKYLSENAVSFELNNSLTGPPSVCVQCCAQTHTHTQYYGCVPCCAVHKHTQYYGCVPCCAVHKHTVLCLCAVCCAVQCTNTLTVNQQFCSILNMEPHSALLYWPFLPQ
jgi:hypothetical protein